jgi:hypothetical protein
MSTRRQFLRAAGTTLGAAGAALAAAQFPRTAAAAEPTEPKRLAVVTTLWNFRSHAWHMAERFLHGYPKEGRWHRPPFKVVSAYVDQRRATDLSQKRAEEFGFMVYPTVAEALRCGGEKLAVDAVLLIGEHGDYPKNEIGQRLYPRYELFKQIAEVYEHDGRTAPVFNDKHLSWSFQRAKEMVETARRLKFPLLAGSSLPVTHRMPAIDLPFDAEVTEALVMAIGTVDIYDFHALEALQSFIERRHGGETGVTAIQALRGEAAFNALEADHGKPAGGGPSLLEACLSRSHMLRQAETYSHRYPTPAEMRSFCPDLITYRIEYRDGLRATMALANRLVTDFTVAARVAGQADPISTLYYLPPEPNVAYSAALMSKAEEMFVTGKAPYPIERTLLTSGLVQSGMQSLHDGQKRLETPHLTVTYQAPKESQFVRT